MYLFEKWASNLAKMSLLIHIQIKVLNNFFFKCLLTDSQSYWGRNMATTLKWFCELQETEWTSFSVSSSDATTFAALHIFGSFTSKNSLNFCEDDALGALTRRALDSLWTTLWFHDNEHVYREGTCLSVPESDASIRTILYTHCTAKPTPGTWNIT